MSFYRAHGKHFVPDSTLRDLAAIRTRAGLASGGDPEHATLRAFLNVALDKWDEAYSYQTYLGLELLELAPDCLADKMVGEDRGTSYAEGVPYLKDALANWLFSGLLASLSLAARQGRQASPAQSSVIMIAAVITEHRTGPGGRRAARDQDRGDFSGITGECLRA